MNPEALQALMAMFTSPGSSSPGDNPIGTNTLNANSNGVPDPTTGAPAASTDPTASLAAMGSGGSDLGSLLTSLLGASGGAGLTTPAAGTGAVTDPNSATDPTGNTEINNVLGNLQGDTISGGNQNVMNLGSQTGSYNTLEQELAQTLGLTDTSGTTAGATSGINNTQGLSTTAGTTGTTGATTSTPTDTLGMGAMLQSLQPSALAATNASNNFLTNEMQQGNPALQQQIGQATSQALSGPGMVGTGNAAQGRAAGTAASQVGINDNALQLQAASQLAGPNAATTLSTAANPFIGSSGTSTGAQTNNSSTGSNTTNQSSGTTASSNNTIGANLGSTISDTGASGTATGTTASTAAGNTPVTSSSGGGCYVCSILAMLGIVSHLAVRHAVEFKLHKRKDILMALGYSIYGPPLARLVLRFSFVRHLMTPIARAILYEELRLARGGKLKLGAWVPHFFFHYWSSMLGLVGSLQFKPDTRDLKIRNILEKEGLLVPVYERT